MSATQNTQTYNASSSYNVNSSFTLQTPIGVNSNMSVYEQAYQYSNSNYVLFVNVGNMQNLFMNSSYNDATNNVNVNLTLNEAAFQSILNSNATSIFYRGTTGANDSTCGFEKIVYNTTDPGAPLYQCTGRQFGFRLLELAANGIFGNAKARAAVKNDSDYMNGTVTDSSQNKAMYNSIANQLATSFTTDRFNIFNQYVNSSRYVNSVDSNQYQNFNFTGTNIQVLLTSRVNTVGTEGNYAGSIGGMPTSHNKSILVMLTEDFNFSNIHSGLRPESPDMSNGGVN